MNITDNLSVPQHQLCNLSIIFSNNAGQSDPLISNLSTYDVINATAYPNGNSICVECVFAFGPSAKSCYVSVIGVTSMNKTFVKNSPSDLTVQGCIDNLPAGNYTVYVYDVENDIPLTSILPAIILRNIVITDLSTTIITVTSSPTTGGIITSEAFPIIIVATTVPSVIVGIVIIIIVIIIVVVVGVYKRERKYSYNIAKFDNRQLSANVQSTKSFESDMTHYYDESEQKKGQVVYQELQKFSNKRPQAPPSSSDKVEYSEILYFSPKTEHLPSNDNIEPSSPSVTIIPANVQDDDIPPPIPAKTDKTSDTTKQTFNNEEITGGLTSSLTNTSEVELILISPQHQIAYHNEGPLPGLIEEGSPENYHDSLVMRDHQLPRDNNITTYL